VLVVTDDHRAAATLTEARSIIDSCPNPGVLSGHLQALEREHTWTSMRGEALTERELAVLRLLAGPGSKRDIAAELFVSVNTVNSQVRSIYQKLGVAARAAAVGRARSAGLIDRVSPG
jgi:LuxR family maltose regulon positive regulatory protein